MAKDLFTKKWITDNAIPIIDDSEKGILTLRALHYRLVGIGMTNTLEHYKRVVNAMIDARWEGLVAFDAFSDHDRAIIGSTQYQETSLEDSIEEAKDAIRNWMRWYSRLRWENQPYYPEVFIEKKALQGVFEKPCDEMKVALGACKGYPSLTFLFDTAQRFIEAINMGKKPIILYFGDYDPSGEDIPRSIAENLFRLGVDGLEVRRIALMEHQVVAWNLPHAPTKQGDSRTAKWTGLGQVELDAIMPNQLRDMCRTAIKEIFDNSLYTELKTQEREESVEYKRKLKDFVIGISVEDDD